MAEEEREDFYERRSEDGTQDPQRRNVVDLSRFAMSRQEAAQLLVSGMEYLRENEERYQRNVSIRTAIESLPNVSNVWMTFNSVGYEKIGYDSKEGTRIRYVNAEAVAERLEQADTPIRVARALLDAEKIAYERREFDGPVMSAQQLQWWRKDMETEVARLDAVEGVEQRRAGFKVVEAPVREAAAAQPEGFRAKAGVLLERLRSAMGRESERDEGELER